MSNKCMNCLKTSRENAGLTQEQAASILGVSVRSISDYENDKTPLPCDLLDKMSKVYGDKYLVYNYFMEKFSASEEYPKVREIELTKGVLNLQSYIEEVSELNREIVRIARDGVVDESEKADWQDIKGSFRDLAGVVMSLSLGDYEKSPSELELQRA